MYTVHFIITLAQAKGHLSPNFWKNIRKEVAGFHWLDGILDIQLLQVSWKNPSLYLILWKH